MAPPPAGPDGRSRTTGILPMLPHALTGLRLASAPLLWWLIAGLHLQAALACLGFAMVSDAVDGSLTRRLGSASRAGAYFDVIADFAVIAAGYSAFAYLAVYPSWVVGLIALAFLLFLVSSRHTAAIYDPVGRYVGGILFAALAATLLFRDLLFHRAILATVTAALAVTLCARAIYFARAFAASRGGIGR